MKKNLLKKGLVVALLITTINTNMVYAANENINYITDNTGAIATYNSANDFYKYGIFDAFEYTVGFDEDIVKVRAGVGAKDFVKIITCNQPSHMVEAQYKFYVTKKADGTMGVKTIVLDSGKDYSDLCEAYAAINNKIITSDMTNYDIAKAVYDYIYDNITYSKSSKASALEVLRDGRAANSDAIAAIAGNLFERAGVVHKTVVGVNKDTYHYFNLVQMGKDYTFDVALDKASGEKYGHFLTQSASFNYTLGALQKGCITFDTSDYKK